MNLCGGFLVGIKTTIERGMSFEHFWNTFNSCIGYARRFESTATSVHISVLDELSRAVDEFFEYVDPRRQSWLQFLAQIRRRDGSNWTLGTTSSGPFLDYVLEYSLCLYMKHRLGLYSKELIKDTGHHLLFQAANKGDAQMTRQLLELGISPNLNIGDKTVWYLVLSRAKEGRHESASKAEYMAKLAEIFQYFIQHNADAKIKVENCSVATIINQTFRGWDHERTGQLLSMLSKFQVTSHFGLTKAPKSPNYKLQTRQDDLDRLNRTLLNSDSPHYQGEDRKKLRWSNEGLKSFFKRLDKKSQ
jgi:hypothetical protein